VKPGGTIIIASACTEGVGSKEFEEVPDQFASIDDFLAAILSGEQTFADQWQLQELAKALRKCKVKVVSGGISAEMLQKFFVIPCATVEEAVAEALNEYGTNASIAVIPRGPCVLALAKHKEPEIKKAEPAKPESKKTEPKTIETPKPEPQQVEAETKKPEPKQPESKQPEASPSEPKQPEPKQPESKQPESKKPEPKKVKPDSVKEKETKTKKPATKKAVKKVTVKKAEPKKAAPKKTVVKKATKKVSKKK